MEYFQYILCRISSYADREYMSNKDEWSIIIEGSHALFCGIFALFSLYFNFIENMKNFYLLCLFQWEHN